MAWIVVDYDSCLMEEQPAVVAEDGVSPPQPDPATGQLPMQEQPVLGSIEAMMQLAQQGHRVTVWTERFAPMPASERDRLKQQLEAELQQWGFPPLEIWTGTTKPAADLFIGPNMITFDQDWPLALTQTQMMLEDRGLLPGPMPDDGNMQGLEDPEAQGGEEPQA